MPWRLESTLLVSTSHKTTKSLGVLKFRPVLYYLLERKDIMSISSWKVRFIFIYLCGKRFTTLRVSIIVFILMQRRDLYITSLLWRTLGSEKQAGKLGKQQSGKCLASRKKTEPTVVVCKQNKFAGRSEFTFWRSRLWLPKRFMRHPNTFVCNTHYCEGSSIAVYKVLVMTGHSCTIFLMYANNQKPPTHSPWVKRHLSF